MGDDSAGGAGRVGLRLQPTRLLHWIGAPERSLHVDHAVDVLKARLGEEVLGAVALSLDRAVVADRVRSRGPRLQPVSAQRRVGEIMEMDVRVDEGKTLHAGHTPGAVAASEGVPAGTANVPAAPGTTARSFEAVLARGAIHADGPGPEDPHRGGLV